MGIGVARSLQKKRVGVALAAHNRQESPEGRREHDMAKAKAKTESATVLKKGNGQKGKSRLEIAQEAHDKAIAKAAATEERLAKAKEAGSIRAEKKRKAATKAFLRALDQLHNAGMLDERGNDALFETFQTACPDAPLDE